MIAMFVPAPVPMPVQSAAESSGTCWQSGFMQLFPDIERNVRIAFRDLCGDSRDEAVQEAVCNACLAYRRLSQQGRPHAATASSLSAYAVRQFRFGRRVANPLNLKDVSSPYCQMRNGICVQSLHCKDRHSDAWQEILVEDHRITPADLAASRIDYPAFLATLGSFRRQIAEALATGETTQRVARLFGVSEGRVSQLRREFMQAWEAFHTPRREKLAVA